MYLYIELWKARSAWLELSKDERQSWMNKTLGALQEHLQSGTVEPIGLVQNDDDTPLSAEYDFFAAWRMPDKEAARKFEDFVEQIGWHEYFEQVNARGQIMEMEKFTSSHLNL